MTNNLTPEALTALANVGTNRQGAEIHPYTATEVRRELQVAGLIGPFGGLTRKGSIVRQRHMDALLDAAF